MKVETHRELRPGVSLHPNHRGERNRVSDIVAHVERADIRGIHSKWPIRLKISLPGPYIREDEGNPCRRRIVGASFGPASR
jgi:hypothetical protein